MKCQAHLRPRQSIRSLARQARAGLEHTLRVRVILPACRPTSPGRGYHPAQPSAAGAHGSAARSPPLGRAALPGPGRSAPAAQRGEDAQVLGTQAAGGPPGLDQLRKHVVGLHELLRRRHPPPAHHTRPAACGRACGSVSTASLHCWQAKAPLSAALHSKSIFG